MNNRWNNLLRIGIVSCLLLLVVVVGFKKAEAFKGTLKIVEIEDFSGPVAKSCFEIRDGVLDYVRYMNEKKGGIAGYKLEIETYDCKYDPALMIPAVKRYADELEVKFIYSAIVAAVQAALDIANEKKCVLMGMSSSVNQAILSVEDEAAGKENYFFATTPVTPFRMSSAIEMIKMDWAKKGKAGVPKIGGFNLDSELGHMATTGGRIYTEAAGFKWVGATYHDKSIMDAVSQVATLKRWGADYVVGAHDYDQPLMVFCKELARQNYRPTVLQHTPIGTVYLTTKDPALEGHMTYQYSLAWPDTSNSEIALMHKLNQEWHPEVMKKGRIPLYTAGWMGAKIFCEGLTRAVKTYGAENMTGPNIKKAFETIRDWDTNGFSPPITFTSWNHQGSRGLRWVKLEGGKLVPISGFIMGPEFSPKERNSKYWLQD